MESVAGLALGVAGGHADTSNRAGASGSPIQAPDDDATKAAIGIQSATQ
jgi:hypothetical protein